MADGWRSYEDSTRIWKVTKAKTGGWGQAGRYAAPPGCSNHVRGEAADLAGDLKLARSLASRHGVMFPYSYKPGYVELLGIWTQSGNLH